jgi:hypothetical protein
MSKPNAPQPPDYVGAANAQGSANLEAARASAKLSNPNLITPYGTQTVSYGTGDQADVPTITQTLSPQEQQILNSQLQTQLGLGGLAQSGIGTLQGMMGKQFDTNGLPVSQVNAGQTAQDAIMARLQPQVSQDREMLSSQLANQGIPIGSQAYSDAMRIQNQKENDLYSQAALQGIGVGQQARQQALSEQLTTRELPLNEITALMSGSQVQLPGSAPYQGQNAAAGNLLGAAQSQGQAANQQYGMNTSQYNANMGGLYGLGGSYLASK